MPFSIRPFRRISVQCAVTNSSGTYFKRPLSTQSRRTRLTAIRAAPGFIHTPNSVSLKPAAAQTTNQGFKSFVPEKAFSGDYIYFALNHFMKLIKANASGSTFKEISGGTLKAVRIHLPPDNLVARFSERVSSLSSQQSLLAKQNQQLTELRDWFLPMLMNGQVTVG